MPIEQVSPRFSVVIGALSVGLVVLCGCNDSDPGTASSPTPGPNIVSPEASSPSPSTDPDSVVRAVGVTPKDLPASFGSKERFGPSGDEVDGQVTLDLCGFAFPSEDLRTARHQVAYTTQDGQMVSSETVTYQPGGAEAAMNEIRSAIAQCPTGFVASGVARSPATKQLFLPLAIGPGWAADTVAHKVVIVEKGGAEHPGAIVYQRSGDTLSGLYTWGPPGQSAQLASRLAAHLSSELDATDSGGTAL